MDKVAGEDSSTANKLVLQECGPEFALSTYIKSQVSGTDLQSWLGKWREGDPWSWEASQTS